MSGVVYILEREISDQMGTDEIVAVFTTREKAEAWAATIYDRRTSIREVSLDPDTPKKMMPPHMPARRPVNDELAAALLAAINCEGTLDERFDRVDAALGKPPAAAVPRAAILAASAKDWREWVRPVKGVGAHMRFLPGRGYWRVRAGWGKP